MGTKKNHLIEYQQHSVLLGYERKKENLFTPSQKDPALVEWLASEIWNRVSRVRFPVVARRSGCKAHFLLLFPDFGLFDSL